MVEAVEEIQFNVEVEITNEEIVVAVLAKIITAVVAVVISDVVEIVIHLINEIIIVRTSMKIKNLQKKKK